MKLCKLLSVLALLLLLCGCAREWALEMPFEASAVTEITLYHYTGAPAAAEKKTVTDPAEIAAICALFEGLAVSDREPETTTGNSVTGFLFTLADGDTFDILYTGHGVKKGLLYSKSGAFQCFTAADVGAYWSNSAAEAVPAEEAEFAPFVTLPAIVNPKVPAVEEK